MDLLRCYKPVKSFLVLFVNEAADDLSRKRMPGVERACDLQFSIRPVDGRKSLWPLVLYSAGRWEKELVASSTLFGRQMGDGACGLQYSIRPVDGRRSLRPLVLYSAGIWEKRRNCSRIKGLKKGLMLKSCQTHQLSYFVFPTITDNIPLIKVFAVKFPLSPHLVKL